MAIKLFITRVRTGTATSREIFALLAIVVMVLTLLYGFLPQAREVIGFITLVLTAAGGLAAAHYLSESLRMQVDQQKRTEAFHFIERWNDPQMFYVRSACYEALDLGQSRGKDAVKELLREKPNLAVNARQLLNLLEEIAIAVRVGHVDEELVVSFFLTLVTRAYRSFEAWIEDHQRIVGTQRIWQELKALTWTGIESTMFDKDKDIRRIP